MAAYFHGGSEFQGASDGGGMQTLYLMNPASYVPYSDNSHGNSGPPPAAAAANMLFLNSAPHALNPGNLPHAPSANHHLSCLPLPTPTVAIGPPNSYGMVPGVHYNLWGGGVSNLDNNNSPGPGHGHGHQHPLQILSVNSSSGPHDGASQLQRPVVSPRQGLSLTLSSQQHQQPGPYRTSSNVEVAEIQGQSGHSTSPVSVMSSGVSGMQSVVLGSKYLRAAQEILDEVVNVGKVLEGTKEVKNKNKESVPLLGEGSSSVGGGGGDDDASKRQAAELTTAQRQELQMKKAKLVNMLDEVEQRYRQYHHQMQAVVSSFEQAAGHGSAKSYTALALQTISKQFRCLKDAITAQIKTTSKSLGEEDCLGAKGEGSRLRFVDHQLRQQRALQQLGMIQNNAWRPQRGLPERAVSVLRAWLFEHFLHPYPKDSDKHMLAKQTGLTRGQVSNWFINARVRLWKPMVEEMYLEEMKEHEKNHGNEEDPSKSKESGSISAAMEDRSVSPKTSKPENSTNLNASASNFPIDFSTLGGSLHAPPQTANFNLIGSSDMDGVVHKSPKKHRSIDMGNSPSSILSMDMEMKFQGEERLMPTNGGYGSYSIGDQMGRFDPEQSLPPRFHGNSVSLTLGLPHFSGNQQNNFLSDHDIQLGRRLDLGTGETDYCGINGTPASHSGAGYQNIELQNRKRFAAQLLPDFVA